MKLSELIARLAEMLEEHGDVIVSLDDFSGVKMPAQQVTFDDMRGGVVIS